MSIPAGSLCFTGFGDSTTMRFLSPLGVDLGQPISLPVPGTGVDGIIQLSDGYYGIIGGNAPNFPNTGVGIFDSQFVVFAEGQASPRFPGRSIARDDTGGFYGGKSFVPSRIMRYINDGTQTREWTLVVDFINVLAVTVDGSKAYYSCFGSNDTVRAWDLTNDIDLGVFVIKSTYSLNHNVLLCTSTGNVLIGWKKGGAAGFIEEYNSSAVLQNTYNLSGTNPAPICLTPGLTTATFWVNYYNGVSTSSGASVVEVTIGGSVGTPFAPDDGSFEFDSAFCVVGIEIDPNPVQTLTGIYKLVPDKTHDTLYDNGQTGTTNYAIPDPTFQTGFVGDEQ